MRRQPLVLELDCQSARMEEEHVRRLRRCPEAPACPRLTRVSRDMPIVGVAACSRELRHFRRLGR